jgi:hypothetical protein
MPPDIGGMGMLRFFVARAGLVVVIMLVAAGCGTSRRDTGMPVANNQLAPGNGAPPAAELSWHELALSARDLRAAASSPYRHAVRMGPQAPLDFSLKGARAVGAGLQAVPFVQPAANTRQVSAFTEDQLIQDGEKFDGAQPLKAVGTLPGQPQAYFDCAVNRLAPDYGQMAYATYKFTLLNAAFEDIPQSIGVLWSEEDAPSEYYIGLSNWDRQRWDWYQGTNDNVLTLGSLYPYYDVNDGTLYVIVVVCDDVQRSLELVQVGAPEVRGLGGASLPPDEIPDFAAPELYFPGKAASFAGSYTLPHVYDRLGYAYDQGETLACTCCAVAAAHNYELARNYAPLWHNIQENRRTSPKWIYKKSAVDPFCWAGRPPETTLNFLSSTGGATELAAPFNLNCDEDWDSQLTEWDRPYLKIDGWRKIRSKEQAGIDEIKQYLSSWERPVIFLATVDGAFLDGTFADGSVWTWNDWVPNEANWHTMLIIGWDDAKGAFLVRNSWGQDWGMAGDVWVSYDTFKSRCWIDCFVLWDDYDEDVADWFGVNAFTTAVPPRNFNASHGAWETFVALGWEAVPGATDYLIYRDDGDTPIATVPGNEFAYNDTTVTGYDQHTYWIRTRVGTTAGEYSSPRGGWLTNPGPPKIESMYLWPDGSAKQGASAFFNAIIYNPDSAGPATLSWDFPPGSIVEASPLSGKVVSVTFDQPGDYTVTLSATNAGGTTQQTLDFTVRPGPQWPQAVFSGPPSAKKNSIVWFDASGSTCDAGQSITEYYWDFQGDGYYEDRTTQASVAHIYPTKGSFSPQVVVRDTRGLFSAWSPPSPIVINDYNEVEPNDADEGAESQTLIHRKTYKASIGAYTGAHDGDSIDWFQFPYNPAYTHYVKVQYDPAQVTELTVKVWGDTFFIYVEDVSTDGLAEIYFPTGEALSTLYTEVRLTGTGGSDYTVSFDRLGEP